MPDRRGRQLQVALSFAELRPAPADAALAALRLWLDSWAGIGAVSAGMAHQGYDLQLTRYDARGWRATFYASGMEHSITGAIGSALQPRGKRADQVAQDRWLEENRRRAWPADIGGGMMIIRAAFTVVLALGLLTAPLAAEAQPQRKVWRVGYLGDGPRAERLGINFEPFRDGLRELGYLDGQNVVIEERWTEGRAERLAELATELVRLKVDVIVTHGVRATRAAQETTRTIPIVAVMPDPVGAGLVASLARPGGNTTGMSDQVTDLAEKEIEILKEALPHVRRVTILWHEGNPGAKLTFEQTRKAAQKIGLASEIVGVTEPDQLETAIARAARNRPDALIVIHDILTVSHRARIAEAALKHGLPTICGSSPFVGRPHRVRGELPRPLQAVGGLRGPDLARGKARRYSDRATDKVRASRESQDSKGARPDDPAVVSAAGG